MAAETAEKEPCCISHVFDRAARRNPTRLAVIHAASSSGSDSERRFTCADLLAAVSSLSRRIAVALRSSTAGSHDESPGCSSRSGGAALAPRVVGVYASPSVEYIAAVLAVLRCGVAFLPLDPSWPEERVRWATSVLNAALVISSEGSRAARVFTSSVCSVIDMDGDLWQGFEDGKGGIGSREELVWPCECERLREFCYVMFTSGSTGKPKGVCGTEKGLLNRFLWMQRWKPLGSDDMLLFKTSVSFVDHLQEFLSAVLTCTTLVIPPPNDWRANPAALANLIKAYGISRVTLVPSLMEIILPTLEKNLSWGHNPLKILIFSGEVLSILLWKRVHELLQETTIINLYGTTEVSGDCTFFDCMGLPTILKREELTSVPIGFPISNCEVCLATDSKVADEGEMHVSGACLFVGYLSESMLSNHTEGNRSSTYYRTGDFARRLKSGEFIFLGRKDRTVKIYGQRFSLQEVECTLKEHPDVNAAAVTFQNNGSLDFRAYLVLKSSGEFAEDCQQCRGYKSLVLSSVRSWLVMKLPPAMIPRFFLPMKSLPLTSSGKIDYVKLSRLKCALEFCEFETERNTVNPHLQVIKKAFCDALLVDEVSEFDDFFTLGGNSISAAHVAHKLEIDMRLLYIYSTPSKLLDALFVDHSSILSSTREPHPNKGLNVSSSIPSSFNPIATSVDNNFHEGKSHIDGDGECAHDHMSGNYANETDGQLNQNVSFPNDTYQTKSLLLDTCSNDRKSDDGSQWNLIFCLQKKWSLGRCNRFMHEYGGKLQLEDVCSYVPYNKRGYLRTLWNIPLNSCVDASPLLVFNDGMMNIFIGSHSQLFLCIDGFSGSVRWSVKLEGRIECSATITGDFLEVVVGCYKGKIYFLDFLTGKLSWTVQTDGEVKMQPVVDRIRKLIWCGSYDQHLYALNYKDHCCIYKISCGGSIYGSPAIDMTYNVIYVASTSGLVTAISLEVLSFRIAWQYEAGAPIFGSLALHHPSGNVICCLVNGLVIAFVAW